MARALPVAVVVASSSTGYAVAQDAPFVNYNPSYSPDGARIVYQSRIFDQSEIYVMDADGSNETRLTNNSADDTHPSFSPDGSRILFDSNRDGVWHLFTMNVDGSDQVRLTYRG